MNIETISPTNTHQNLPVEGLQPIVVVCDVANYQALTAVSAYLQAVDLLDPEVNVQVVPPAAYPNEKVKSVLAEDQAVGRVGFVLIKDNACRHYFKTAEQADFSLHITPLQ